MGWHREDLIKRLSHVLEQLDHLLHIPGETIRRSRYLAKHASGVDGDGKVAKEQYGELKRVLLEVDAEAAKILIRTSS